MKKHIQQLTKHSMIFGLGDSLKSLVSFLFIPLYTRYLTPVDYAHLELLYTTLTILLTIVSQGMGPAFFRSYAFIEKELDTTINKLISTSYTYMLLSGFFIGTLVYIFSDQYSRFLFGSNSSAPELVNILAVALFFQVMTVIPFQLYRANLESVKFITISVSAFVVQIALNILFIVVINTGLKGIMISLAVSNLFITVASFFHFRQQLVIGISKKILANLLPFGLPLVLSGVCYWLIQMSDRFLLQKLSTSHELGLYSLGVRFANILMIFIVLPFQRTWGAFKYQIVKQDEARETFSLITTYFFLILCFMGTLIILWAPPVIKLMAHKDFWDASRVVLPLVYANIASAMFYLSGFGMYLHKRTGKVSLLVGLGALISISVNLLIIPKYGMMGAAFSSLISYSIVTLLSYHISQKLYYIPLEQTKLMKIGFVFVLVTYGSTLLTPSYMPIDILYRVVLNLLFCLGLFVVKLFDIEEISFCKHAYRRFTEAKGVSNKIRYALEHLRG